MRRVIAYVDGFTLYFSLMKEPRFKRDCWLDVAALAQSLLKPERQLAGTHYFTARIRSNGRSSADQKRQQHYLEALGLCGVRGQLGQHLGKKRQCRKCGASWADFEEKMTDVNIAIQLLTDAFYDAFDVALVISGDSDLTTPIWQVRERFPAKRAIVAFPPKRSSSEFQRHASGHISIGEDKLRQSQLPEHQLSEHQLPEHQLPEHITTPDGYVLTRPDTWR